MTHKHMPSVLKVPDTVDTHLSVFFCISPNHRADCSFQCLEMLSISSVPVCAAQLVCNLSYSENNLPVGTLSTVGPSPVD